MTSTTITVQAADGTVGSIPLVVNSVAPVYPYPILKYTDVVKAGDSFYKALLHLTKPTIVDMAGAPGIVVDFAVAVWNLSVSNNGGYGLFVANLAGLLNADVSMQPMSSTKGPFVAALPPGSSDQYVVMRLGGVGSMDTGPAFLTGKLTGTPQGHVYTGFQLYNTIGSVIGPFVVTGIPGSDGVPPGETFSIATYHAQNVTFNDCEVDGANKTAASGFYSNGPTTTITHNRSKAHGLQGGGFTYYQNTNWTFNFNDCESHDNGGAGFNFEQCGGATIKLTRPHVGNNPVDLIVDSTSGSAKVTITDPVYTDGRTSGKFNVVIHKVYSYGLPKALPVTQLASDITLIIGGVVRNDLLNIQDHYVVNGATR